MNLVVLKGNLTRDPELVFLGEKNTPKVSMGIAVNRKYKKGDEWVEAVDFFDVEVWGRQAENCAEYLSKGRPALIQGELRLNTWENDDGQKRSKVFIVALRVEFLGTGKSKDSESREEDDIPF